MGWCPYGEFDTAQRYLRDPPGKFPRETPVGQPERPPRIAKCRHRWRAAGGREHIGAIVGTIVAAGVMLTSGVFEDSAIKSYALALVLALRS